MRGTAAEPRDQRHLQAEATQGPVASRDKGESIRYITAALYVLVCARMKGESVSPLKPELNPIRYLLALLGAHHFLHVSRIRVKLLTLR